MYVEGHIARECQRVQHFSCHGKRAFSSQILDIDDQCRSIVCSWAEGAEVQESTLRENFPTSSNSNNVLKCPNKKYKTNVNVKKRGQISDEISKSRLYAKIVYIG